jgi:hypothetical protein
MTKKQYDIKTQNPIFGLVGSILSKKVKIAVLYSATITPS